MSDMDIGREFSIPTPAHTELFAAPLSGAKRQQKRTVRRGVNCENGMRTGKLRSIDLSGKENPVIIDARTYHQ
jgi:hypothetical protein